MLEMIDARPDAVAAPDRRIELERVTVDGKYLSAAGRTFRVRGVTYGSFRDRGDGFLFPEAPRIRSDFEAIAAAGLNTVRTYCLPPPEAFDAARDLGLRLIVGLHYDDWRGNLQPSRRTNAAVLRAGRRAVEQAMEACAGRAEVLAISIGNEVPGDLVRLHGARSVAAVLGELAAQVHRADPRMLVTYSSYPTTEYLRIPGLDLWSFNVFLERRSDLRAYLKHLQVVSGEIPLVVSELGLASAIHGEPAQAEVLEWQLREIDESGCAGATVFSWTDEWAVGGRTVEGWGFGVTDARRRAKPAVDVLATWASRSVRDLRERWPSISVVVCSYNAAATIDECLASFATTDYPGLEVLVCDDGSTDGTADLARRHPFRVLELPHGGLGAARNAGIRAARGDIVAFVDSDAKIHPEWPYRLALAFEDPSVGAAGGPNLPVEGGGFVERAVASAPGNPTHVLLTDDRAEHVPGCNMAVRREDLRTIGGFDAGHTAAGDDVDVCWKILDAGREIAFAPQAQVRHHRRASVGAYLRQQRGYGRAEKAVSRRHRHRFNRFGQARWRGSIYGGPAVLPRLLQPVVYHGWLGMAPFQKVQRHRAEPLLALAAAYLPALVPLALAGVLLAPFNRAWLVVPALAAAAAAAYFLAVALAVQPPRDEGRPVAHRLLVAYLHVVQPVVRTWARLRGHAVPVERDATAPAWLGDRPAWLRDIERDLLKRDLHVSAGSPTDGHDLIISAGLLVRCRLTTAVAWSWYPIHRMSFRPSLAGWVVAAAAALAVLRSPLVALSLAVGATVVAAVDVALLRRAVRQALLRTSRAAQPAEEPRARPGAGNPARAADREASQSHAG